MSDYLADSDYLAVCLTDCVRRLLRQHEPFAGMSRDDIDNNILADLERELRRELEGWIAATEYEIRDEIEADLKYEAEYEAEMKAAAKKAKRTKSQAGAP
jgi:hypothetical protein